MNEMAYLCPHSVYRSDTTNIYKLMVMADGLQKWLEILLYDNGVSTIFFSR